LPPPGFRFFTLKPLSLYTWILDLWALRKTALWRIHPCHQGCDVIRHDLNVLHFLPIIFSFAALWKIGWDYFGGMFFGFVGLRPLPGLFGGVVGLWLLAVPRRRRRRLAGFLWCRKDGCWCAPDTRLVLWLPVVWFSLSHLRPFTFPLFPSPPHFQPSYPPPLHLPALRRYALTPGRGSGSGRLAPRQGEFHPFSSSGCSIIKVRKSRNRSRLLAEGSSWTRPESRADRRRR